MACGNGKCSFNSRTNNTSGNCNCGKDNYNERSNNIPNIRTIKSFENAIEYKNSQKETVTSLKDITVNIISVIQNSFCTEADCFRQEALTSADQYVSISNRTCDCKKIALIGNGKFYGTVEDISGETNFPVSESNGFGGIRESHDISGTFIFDLNGSDQVPIMFSEGDDVAFLANKIRERICNKVSVVDGTELSLKIDASGCLTFNFSIESKEIGNNYSAFSIVNDASEATYKNLIEEIKNTFEPYIDYIWYDVIDENIRIIFNAGYSVLLSNDIDSSGSIILESFVNDKFVTSVNIVPGASYVAYGYLQFYSSCESFIIRYPPGSLAASYVDVPMTIIAPSDEGYCNNVTFNLTNMWCCMFETIAKICIQYDRCSRNVIDIKAFHSWALILKNLIKCLKFDCTIYDVWRRNNAIKSLDSLIFLLENLCLVLENQKELLKIMKCDFIEFSEKCCSVTQYSRFC